MIWDENPIVFHLEPRSEIKAACRLQQKMTTILVQAATLDHKSTRQHKRHYLASTQSNNSVESFVRAWWIKHIPIYAKLADFLRLPCPWTNANNAAPSRRAKTTLEGNILAWWRSFLAQNASMHYALIYGPTDCHYNAKMLDATCGANDEARFEESYLTGWNETFKTCKLTLLLLYLRHQIRQAFFVHYWASLINSTSSLSCKPIARLTMSSRLYVF